MLSFIVIIIVVVMQSLRKSRGHRRETPQMVAAVTIIIILSSAEPSLESYHHSQFCVSEDTLKDLLSPPPPFLPCLRFTKKCTLKGNREGPLLYLEEEEGGGEGTCGTRLFQVVLHTFSGGTGLSCFPHT